MKNPREQARRLSQTTQSALSHWAVLRNYLLRGALHSLRLRGAVARGLTCGLIRAGEAEAQRIETKRRNSREIQLAGLRIHILRSLEVLDGRLGVGSPLTVHANRAVYPVRQCLLY